LLDAAFSSPPYPAVTAEAMAVILTVFLSCEPTQDDERTASVRLSLVNAIQLSLIAFTFATIGLASCWEWADKIRFKRDVFYGEFQDFADIPDHPTLLMSWPIPLGYVSILLFATLAFCLMFWAYSNLVTQRFKFDETAPLKSRVAYLISCALFVGYLFLKLPWYVHATPAAGTNALLAIVVLTGGFFAISQIVKLLRSRAVGRVDWFWIVVFAISALIVVDLPPLDLSAPPVPRRAWIIGAAFFFYMVVVGLRVRSLIRWAAGERYVRPLAKALVSNIDEGRLPPVDRNKRSLDEIYSNNGDGPPFAPDSIRFPRGGDGLLHAPLVLFLYAYEWIAFLALTGWYYFEILGRWLGQYLKGLWERRMFLRVVIFAVMVVVIVALVGLVLGLEATGRIHWRLPSRLWFVDARQWR